VLQKDEFSSNTIASLLQKEGFYTDTIASRLQQDSEVAKKLIHQIFEKSLNRQNGFIGTFLRVQSISVASIDSFILDRGLHPPLQSAQTIPIPD
jgi:hypothetical protein